MVGATTIAVATKIRPVTLACWSGDRRLNGEVVSPSINLADCLLIVTNIPRPVAAGFGSFLVTVLVQYAVLIGKIDGSLVSVYPSK
jgi:hypothetical protein